MKLSAICLVIAQCNLLIFKILLLQVKRETGWAEEGYCVRIFHIWGDLHHCTKKIVCASVYWIDNVYFKLYGKYNNYTCSGIVEKMYLDHYQ